MNHVGLEIYMSVQNKTIHFCSACHVPGLLKGVECCEKRGNSV